MGNRDNHELKKFITRLQIKTDILSLTTTNTIRFHSINFVLFFISQFSSQTIPAYTNLPGALVQNCEFLNARVTSTVPGVTFGGACTLIT